jgi:low affinity Fe/Cu permease
MKRRNSYFSNFASRASELSGRPGAFLLAVTSVLVWAVTGPMFHYSETWQMVINTGTTIVTFLLVFLIQNSQNRDTRAIQIKVDELIRATQGAHTSLLDLEKLTDEEISEMSLKYELIAEESRKRLHLGMDDVHVPDVDVKIKSLQKIFENT